MRMMTYNIGAIIIYIGSQLIIHQWRAAQGEQVTTEGDITCSSCVDCHSPVFYQMGDFPEGTLMLWHNPYSNNDVT